MSRLFGPARQNGIVVRDLDAALAYWTQVLGVGPFFRFDNLQNASFFQRETELPAPEMSIALGNWGDLQIELICPHGDGGSTWHNFLRERGGGLHHTSVWTPDFDAAMAQAETQGLVLEARGQVLGGGRYAYLQSGSADQPLLEVAEVTEPVRQTFDFIRQCAVDWDGADPVRTVG